MVSICTFHNAAIKLKESNAFAAATNERLILHFCQHQTSHSKNEHDLQSLISCLHTVVKPQTTYSGFIPIAKPIALSITLLSDIPTIIGLTPGLLSNAEKRKP